MTDTHVALEGSRRPPPKNCVRLGDLDANTSVDATVTLRGPDLPIAAHMPNEALSRKEIAEKFGVAKETVQKVERVLQSYGLQVLEVAQCGRTVKVRGSTAAIWAAFRPNFGIYEVIGVGPIRAREGILMIPHELEGIVTGVFGLDSRRMAKGRPHAGASNNGKGGYTPAEVGRHYNFPDGDGAGTTIAIAAFGEVLENGQTLAPYIPADVGALYTSKDHSVPKIRLECLGLTPLTKGQFESYRRLPKESKVRGQVSELYGETMMDVQIVAELCPKADIGIYLATRSEGGWVNLLDALSSGPGPIPVAVAISYGLSEDVDDWSHAALTAINERLQIAALQGITVCVASGDDGTGCWQSDKRCHVEFPSSSPYVLSVGGTMLVTQQGGQTDAEVVWWEAPGWRDNGGGATGGGVSVSNLRAPWQTVQIPSLNPDAQDGRVVPDVSALAGPPYYRLRDGYGQWYNGGTSAATPLWASLIALIDAALPPSKRQRFLPPLLYKPGVGPAGFCDIRSGHNNASQPNPGIGYEATVGFDAVTGWGVPHGRRLLDALATV
jgi:kumamolisin